jgi:predicted ATPase/class 3 adenylate cyclase
VETLSAVTTFLFTDIEGSTRLWEKEPERMGRALACHDAVTRAAVQDHHGTVVKMTGDGVHAVFENPVDALAAALQLQHALADLEASNGVALRVRCGIHAGIDQQHRDNDFFGKAVHRAARIMSAAHGGQVLLSQAVAALAGDHLPAGVALRDLGSVRLKDFASPEHVYQLVHPQLRQEFPALRSLEVTPNNLPQQISSFIGRRREISNIELLLAQSRLLTLVGVGGIGKTRLSLQVAAAALDVFPDGVWLVELGSISDPSLVPSSVAQALGVQESSGTSLTHTLCSYLKTRRLLLVLDNCEHLTRSCAELVRVLLGAASDIRILASSREPLRISGEQTFPVPPLSLPDQEASPENILRAEAVQLFIERVRLQQPDFVLAERQVPAVTALCTHLDGIPLALELAAARVHSLSIEEISAHLKDCLKLLMGQSRTALPHQQTLRATLDWSYGMLAARERAVLNRLAIFAGGFTFKSAAAVVTSDDGIDEFEAIDRLACLVARSLVVADAGEVGTRYRLLETTRAYALEKLGEAGETATIAARHAAIFRELFEVAYEDRNTLSDADWCSAYVPERDNLRAALDWALGPGGDEETGIALAGSSGKMWVMLSLVTEGRQRLEAAVARIDPTTPPLLEARCWQRLGMLLGNAEVSRSLTAYERAIALYRAHGDATALGGALARLGGSLARSGRAEVAKAALLEARPLLDRTPNSLLLGIWSENFGFLQAISGRPADARPYYEAALTFYRSAGANRKVLFMLSNIADMNWALGNLDRAIASFREAVALARATHALSKASLAVPLGNLAGALTELGNLDEAHATACEAISLQQEDGTVWMWLDHYALLVELMGRHTDAARLEGYADAVHSAQGMTPRQSNEARARTRLLTLLAEKIPALELERLLAEGAKMNQDEACRMALGDQAATIVKSILPGT